MRIGLFPPPCPTEIVSSTTFTNVKRRDTTTTRMASAVSSGVDRDQLRQRGTRKGEKARAEPAAESVRETKKEEREVVDGSVSDFYADVGGE